MWYRVQVIRPRASFVRPGRQETLTVNTATTSHGPNGGSEALGIAHSITLACIILATYRENAASTHRAKFCLGHTAETIVSARRVLSRHRISSVCRMPRDNEEILPRRWDGSIGIKGLLPAKGQHDLPTTKKTAAHLSRCFADKILFAGMSPTVVPEIGPGGRIVGFVTLSAIAGIGALTT